MLAGYWPQATEEGEFATKLNSLSKVVVSSTLESVLWGKWEGAEIIKNNVAEEIAKLKQQPGKDIVLWGSLTLARSLMQAGLIDEVQHYEGATLVAGRGGDWNSFIFFSDPEGNGWGWCRSARPATDKVTVTAMTAQQTKVAALMATVSSWPI